MYISSTVSVIGCAAIYFEMTLNSTAVEFITGIHKVLGSLQRC